MRLPALLAVPIALVGLAVPAAAEDPGLTITWPSVTQIEVPTTSYTINVADTAADPQGTLYAEWQGERQELPHSGAYTVDFTKGGTGTIKVVRCVPADPEPVCTDTGDVSPELQVVHSLDSFHEPIDTLAAPGQTVRYRVQTGEEAAGQLLKVDWELQAVSTWQTVATGTATVRLNAEAAGTFPVLIPASATSGDYDVRTVLSAEIAPFGPYRGGSAATTTFVTVDGDTPTLSAATSATSIYPHRDRYRDSIALRIRSSEYVGARIEVVNGSGKVVRTMLRRPAWYEHRLTYDGRTASGALLPVGSYKFRVTVTDPVGLKTTKLTRSFWVSHKRLVKKTWKRTFSAAAATSPKSTYAGKCSTLRRPSLRGWTGSLGFYSQTKCTRRAESAVTTVSGVWVPKAFQNRYGTLQVSMYGGGARGRGPHKGRNAYIVMAYRSTAKQYVHRSQFNGVLGNHAGPTAAASSLVFDKSTKPYVLWLTGLTEGSRYDVKSYTVKLTYTVLQ